MNDDNTERGTPNQGKQHRWTTRPKRLARRQWLGFLRNTRSNFLAGVLVTAPLGITVYIVWAIINWVDDSVTPLLPALYNPETYLPFRIPGTGLIVVFIMLTMIGALTTGLVGRFWVHTTQRVMARMPVVRSVYGAIKQVFETILQQKSTAFRQVVLFEYPRRGCWALGFITGRTLGEVQSVTADEVVNVFLPTTPNPTSGYLLFLPRKDLVELDMSVEEGIKMVVSGGIVTPPDRRPAEVQHIPHVAPAEGERKTIPYEHDEKRSTEPVESA